MNIRHNYIRNIYRMLILLKKKSEICLTVVEECSTFDDKLRALCGVSKHTASSENYFIDSSYHNIISSKTSITKPLIKEKTRIENVSICYDMTLPEVNITEPFIMNVKGQTVNVLPLILARHEQNLIRAKKTCLCNSLCKINPLLIDRYQKFLEVINTCTVKNVPKLIQKVFECTVKISNEKLGHPNSCYIDLNLCEAMSLSMQLLASHFPNVRYIRRLIYRLKDFYEKILKLDKALNFGDLNTLYEIITLAQEKADMYKYQQTSIILSDNDIISKYHNTFKALTKRSIDTPRHICVSCERLCHKRNVSQISKLQA